MIPNARAILHTWNQRTRDRLADNAHWDNYQRLWAIQVGATLGVITLVVILGVLIGTGVLR